MSPSMFSSLQNKLSGGHIAASASTLLPTSFSSWPYNTTMYHSFCHNIYLVFLFVTLAGCVMKEPSSPSTKIQKKWLVNHQTASPPCRPHRRHRLPSASGLGAGGGVRIILLSSARWTSPISLLWRRRVFAVICPCLSVVS